MIKSEREYAVTRSWVGRFEAAMAGMDAELANGADRMLVLERAGLQNKTDEMKDDIAEYESLKSGRIPPVDAGNLEELPEALIKRRIGLGMTQRELAERAGMSEEEVQRHEQTDYESAGYARLMEVHAALSPGTGPGTGPGTECGDAPNAARVLARIKGAGLEGGFVEDCILGGPGARCGGEAGAAVRERKLLSRLYKIYGWPPRQVLGSAPLGMDRARARFKLPAGADRAVVNAHAVYAGHVAGILARASRGVRQRPVPGDPHRLREGLRGDGAVTFAGLVEYAWSAGIAVGHLPPLAFHAAHFDREGRGVIMLSRAEASEPRLMLDLAHELYHAGRGGDSIDVDEHDASAEESEANEFAHAVLVGRGADLLFRSCMDRCSSAADARDPAALERAVSEAALEEGVRADLLANYVAYRLADEEPARSWRGAAQGMQEKMPGWRGIVTSAIASHADLAGLSASDFGLLSDVMAAWLR